MRGREGRRWYERDDREEKNRRMRGKGGERD